jgi:tripartite-type tricarboxylate transporter receptor subunit TctC
VRAIELSTAFAAGGTTDLVARMTATYLGKKWGVPINVVNKPGGNTVPANLDIYNAPPDGYALLADSIGSSSILPTSVQSLPFQVLDRTFVSMISSNSMLIFVAPGSPIKTLKDVADEAKRDPASFTWTGVGVAEIPMRQLLREAGVDITKTKAVVSTGSVSATVLAANGSVKVGIAAVGSALAQVSSGLVRPVAIAAEKRWETLPDVTTSKEAGYPMVQIVSWIGITGPAKLPSYIVDKWSAGIKEMLADPQIITQLKGFASIADYRDSAAFREEVTKEVREMAALWK